MVHEDDAVREDGADDEPENNSGGHVVYFFREPAGSNAGNDALEGRAGNDAEELRPHLGREPRRSAVDSAEYSSEENSEKDLVHLLCLR